MDSATDKALAPVFNETGQSPLQRLLAGFRALSPVAWAKRGLAYAFARSADWRTGAHGRPLMDTVEQQMVTELQSWPPVQVQALVVLGTGPDGKTNKMAGLSGLAARRLVEMVYGGALEEGGTIYFTGGASPQDMDRRSGLGLLDRQTQEALVDPPSADESVARYMLRIFREDMELLEVDLSRYVIKVDDGSRDMRESIQAAAAMGAGRHMLVGLVTPPDMALAAMDQWRNVMGGNAILRPMVAWFDEIGVVPLRWKKDYRTVACMLEAARDHAGTGKQRVPAVDIGPERDAALDALAIQNRPLAREWSERYFKGKRPSRRPPPLIEDDKELRRFLRGR